MAYQNPKPVLHDEQTNGNGVQGGSVAEYTPMKSVYFAFLDVLGFKQTFDENREKPDNEFASLYKNVFQYFSLLMNSTRFADSGNQWNFGQTSDSLYFYTSRVDYLAAFIKLHSHFSLYAMSQNVFFRGGIAKGGLFVDKPHQFYGDSVIKAYLLENNIAKSPCIIIDQSTRADLLQEKSVSDFVEIKDPPLRSFIKPFVYISENELQYLISISLEVLHKIGDEERLLIRENIAKNINRFEFDDKNFQKYAYLQSEYAKSLKHDNKI